MSAERFTFRVVALHRHRTPNAVFVCAHARLVKVGETVGGDIARRMAHRHHEIVRESVDGVHLVPELHVQRLSSARRRARRRRARRRRARRRRTRRRRWTRRRWTRRRWTRRWRWWRTHPIITLFPSLFTVRFLTVFPAVCLVTVNLIPLHVRFGSAQLFTERHALPSPRTVNLRRRRRTSTPARARLSRCRERCQHPRERERPSRASLVPPRATAASTSRRRRRASVFARRRSRAHRR